MYKVLDIPLFSGSIKDVRGLISRWIDDNQNKYICVTSVHGVVESQSDNNIKRAHLDADLVVPDGMPLVWLGKMQGHNETERIYGPDLFLDMNKVSEKKRYKIYLYGTTEDTLQKLRNRLTLIYPNIIICGSYAPPFRKLKEAEEKSIINGINLAKPDIVWVGMSTPKQELWMNQYRSKLNAKVLIGVGAAFDFVAGTKKQAPILMRKIGLEWAYRLFKEPKRLGKRYALNNIRFIFYIVSFYFR